MVNRCRIVDEVVTEEFVTKLLLRLLSIPCLLPAQSFVMSLGERVIRGPSLAWTPFPKLCSEVAPTGCKHAQPRADAPPAIAENMLTQICCGKMLWRFTMSWRSIPVEPCRRERQFKNHSEERWKTTANLRTCIQYAESNLSRLGRLEPSFPCRVKCRCAFHSYFSEHEGLAMVEV